MSEHIVVAGGAYHISTEPADRKGGWGYGHGGSAFRIARLDGSPIDLRKINPHLEHLEDGSVISHNLWFGGEIPADFRDVLPDDHKFIREAAIKFGFVRTDSEV